ncbi:hypothetical protein GXM_07374 [Nostoc sphaeroides CCNUC1]|uniref:Uncharacterized protein n=1 Tax=Nostoc sphaeroides CCNUC1 TaxID=2653204 RepID=A0A5P8WB26_9NOSO|nr:hypothetical protein GXM_07374 [Nostoc sphaeroides CCNUC1]
MNTSNEIQTKKIIKKSDKLTLKQPEFDVKKRLKTKQSKIYLPKMK